MLCRICGTPIKEGERFCSLCGTKTENAGNAQQDRTKRPYGGQSYRRQSYRRRSDNRQPYGGQPDGQYFDQPFGRQPGGMYYSAATKSKKGLWITLSLVAVIAVAVVLMFTVFWDRQAVTSERTLPFKGDTLQTQFANDTAKVMSDAFDIFGNIGIDMNDMAEQPFDLNLDLKIKSLGQEIGGSVKMAYDNETFGMNINAEGASVKILLLEDVLYMDWLGTVARFDISSSADLSKPMSLSDRLIALSEGLNLPQNLPSKEGYTTLVKLLMQSTISGGGNTALAEALINSVDESCFESNGSKTTLTLHTEDIADTLRTFVGKLDADEELKKTYEDLVKAGSGNSEDVIKQLNDAADKLEEQKDALDLGLVWGVSYKDEKPVSFEIRADDGAETYVYSFGYEQNGDITDITFESTPGNSSDSISGVYNFKKSGSGTEISGSMITQGQIMTFYGNIAFSGNNTYGTITISVPNTAYVVEVSYDFNLTLNIGMPHTKVKDDSRFKIDTESAFIIDASSMAETIGLPVVY